MGRIDESIPAATYQEWLDLPPDQCPPGNDYVLLGIDVYEPDVDVIKKAVNDRINTVRPRCLKDPELGTRLLTQITQVSLRLTDAQKKFEYDMRLRAQGVVGRDGDAAHTQKGKTPLRRARAIDWETSPASDPHGRPGRSNWEPDIIPARPVEGEPKGRNDVFLQRRWQFLGAAATCSIVVLLLLLFLPSNNTGTVRIRLANADPSFVVRIDEQRVDVDRLASPIPLSDGRHRLSVSQPDFVTHRSSFVVSSGEQLELSVNLKPLTAPPDPGPVHDEQNETAQRLVAQATALVDDQENYEDAITVFGNAIALSPQLTEAYVGRGKAYKLSGDTERAIVDFSEAIRLDPDYAGAYRQRAGGYRSLGQNESALADLSRLIELDSTDAVALHDRGTLLRAAGKHDEAIDDFTAAIQLNPDYADAYLERGVAHFSTGDRDAEISDYTEAIRIKPDFALAFGNRGLAYEAKGLFDLAVADYTRAIESDPDYVKPRYNRGEVYLEHLKKYDLALDDFTACISLDPNHVRAHNARGVAYDRLGDIESAIGAYGMAIEVSPGFVLALKNRILAYKSLKQYDLAAEDHTRIIALAPNDPDAYYDRGALHVNFTKKYNLAVADFSSAINLRPNHADSFVFRGVAYARQGDTDAANADYSRAIQIAPDYILPLRNRAYNYQSQGQRELALADFLRIIEIDPKDSDAQFQCGFLNAELGNYKAAVANYSAAIAVRPSFAMALNNRGVAHGNLDELDAAVADYTAAIRIEPDHELAHGNRAKIYKTQNKHDLAAADEQIVRLLKDFDEMKKRYGTATRLSFEVDFDLKRVPQSPLSAVVLVVESVKKRISLRYARSNVRERLGEAFFSSDVKFGRGSDRVLTRVVDFFATPHVSNSPLQRVCVFVYSPGRQGVEYLDEGMIFAKSQTEIQMRRMQMAHWLLNRYVQKAQ